MSITDDLRAFGITLPAELERITAVREALDTELNAEASDLADIVAATPDTAVAMFRQLVNEQATRQARLDAAADLSGLLDDAEAKILRDTGDQIIEQIRPSFEKAAQQLGRLVKVLGPEPTAEAAIAAKAVNEFEQFPIVLAEVERLAGIVELLGDRRVLGRFNMFRLLPGYYRGDPVPLVFLEDVDVDSWPSAQEAWSCRFPGLLAAGFQLTLNTPAQILALQEKATPPPPEPTPTPDETDTATSRGLLELELRERGGVLATEGGG